MTRLGVVFVAFALWASSSLAAEPASFKVGFAKRDITPRAAMPMWGYGDRHDKLSQSVLDPLFAKAIVIEAGGERLAIVGLDIGRGPTIEMMQQIRREVAEKALVTNVMISGSHSHHGPVIELTDREGFGKGKFDAAVAYAKELPRLLIEAIIEAKEKLEPARMGIQTKDIDMNRNRHTKREPKPVDPMLAVIRFDTSDGKPLAILVNYAAHPTSLPSSLLEFSADYPGAMQSRVESALSTNCFFMQGAAGDMSTERRGLDMKAYGEAIGDHVVAIARSIETAVPENPSIKVKRNQFKFASRVDYSNPLVTTGYGRAFFPELVANFTRDMRDGIQPEMTTVLLNGNLGLVGGSGEFFCNHSRRLKERAYLPHTLFFGYCNGHDMYFPTIEAASEGGYGGDPSVSPVAIGAGEIMMNQALINLYTMVGKFPPETAK